MSKPLQQHFFCQPKTNIGQHLQQHCRMLLLIPMAKSDQSTNLSGLINKHQNDKFISSTVAFYQKSALIF